MSSIQIRKPCQNEKICLVKRAGASLFDFEVLELKILVSTGIYI